MNALTGPEVGQRIRSLKQSEDWNLTNEGQIGNNDSANDVRDVDLTRVHYLTGPFEIEGAEPGDILLVDIQDVQPLQDEPWGFTGVFAKENGGGFLDQLYPKPYVEKSQPNPQKLLTFAQSKGYLGFRGHILQLSTHSWR